ncbi:MAG: DNA polymerase IV [Pseudomonadota bacterium]
MTQNVSTPRRIAHLDMDMFFAGVELLQYPQLRGLPVVIGGRSGAPEVLPDGSLKFARLRDYVGRGVVTTSTYEARALGVFSAMGLMKSAKLAPDAILLPSHFDAYKHYSRLFKEAVAAIAPHIEDRGIDEIYIDLTDMPEADLMLAQRIKAAVQSATGLSCSICIAPNKLLAKIGSDLDKPDGLTLLDESSIAIRIWPLAVRKINGIGPKATQKLASLDIKTIGELAATDIRLLQAHFSPSYAQWLLDAAHGRDERPVVTSSEPKSLSRETTFERDLHARHDKEQLGAIFTMLCERVADDLKRKGYVGRTIGIKLRYDDYSIVTRDCSLETPIQDAMAIRKAAGLCLKRAPLIQKLRLLGVRVSALSREGQTITASEEPQSELPFGTDG